jgi:chaperonin cofactor prefoldin
LLIASHKNLFDIDFIFHFILCKVRKGICGLDLVEALTTQIRGSIKRGMKFVAKVTVRGLFIIITGLFLGFVTLSFAKEVPFTQEDRERLIRIEIKVEEGQKALNQRIDDLGKRIDDTNRRVDDLRDLIYVGIGGMIALIGFVIWDRRTALAPAIRKNKELEEREEKIEIALKELAKKDPNVAEVLKHVGLL